MALRGLIVWLGVFAMLAPAGARAWTDTRARSVQVHLELDAHGNALVAMVVHLRVHGGWLEGFEVSGLDPDLRLVEGKAPWFVSEDGEKHRPRVRVRRGGRVLFSFTRRDAPRRGRYRLGFVYRTALGARGVRPIGGGRVQVSWTLPGWQAGLEDVRVSVLAPAGARVVSPDESVPAHVRADALGGVTLLRYRRVHLPRTTPWTVALTLPERAVAEGLRGPAARAARARTREPRPRRVWVGGLLALGVWLLSWLSARQLRRGARALGARVASLASPRLLALSGLGLSAAASVLWSSKPGHALAAVALLGALHTQRVSWRPQVVSLGSWRPLRARDFRRARLGCVRQLLGRAPWGDACTLCGALGLAGLAGVALWAPAEAWRLDGEPWAWGVLCALPTWLAGSRLRLPPTTAQRVLTLRRAACGLDVWGVGARLVWYADLAGQRCQPRLRLFPAVSHAGLTRLDVCAASRGGLCLLALTQAGSFADRVLSARSDLRTLSPGGQRAAHQLMVGDDLSADVRDLLALLAARGAALCAAPSPEARTAA